MSRPVAAVAAVVVMAALMAGCTHHLDESIPKPPPSLAAVTTTTALDLTGVSLAGVSGRTTTTVVVGPGGATINGSVGGPDGAVPGAVVRAERLTDAGAASVDVATQPDGTFTVPAVLGGRYRVRSWRAPDLALVSPEIFFLGGTETHTVNLVLTRYSGTTVQGAIAPSPPVVDQPANLVVQVTNDSVDQQGIVRALPVPGTKVELTGGSGWEVGGANPALTRSDGEVFFAVTCTVVGAPPLATLIDDTTPYPLNIPACAALPPTTVPPTTTTSSLPGSTTSTTVRRRGTTTTGP